MDALWRLVWALPVELVTGVAAMLVLRRVLGRHHSSPATREPRLRAIETLAVSDETRAYLVEIDRRPMLVIESTRQVTLQEVPLHASTGARQHLGSSGQVPRRGFGGMR